MENIMNILLEEEKHLEQIINTAKKELSDVPDGYLRISKDKNRTRYYQCISDKIGTYIPKADIQLPKQLAQKTYNKAVVKIAESRLKQLKRLITCYSGSEIEELYTSLHKERQALIIPVEPTWDQKLEEWFAEEYCGKEFREGTPIILTERGERVRSKSEKILADFFDRRNILYKYEKPLFLKGYGVVYPDFTFLSRRTGREIYWEHEGMMDKEEYARSAVKKIESYQMNRIYPGESLILTFETEQSVLNSKVVEGLVEKYLI